MRDEEFEWDEAKAAANLARHGVSFETARLAFDDEYASRSRTAVAPTGKSAMS